MLDRGLMSFALGHVALSAAAATAGEGLNFVSVDASIHVANADMSVVHSTRSAADGSRDGVSISSQTLEIDFIAVDFGGLNPFCAPLVREQSETAPGHLPASPSGNAAVFDIAVTASGDNSAIDLALDAFTLEDQLSSVTATATTAVENQTTYRICNGTSRADTLTTADDDSLVRAGRGDDTVRTGAGDDWIFGESGKDRIYAGGGDDNVFGGEGRDWIAGGHGGDWLFGGDSDDEVQGDDGHDLLFGNDGDDRLTGGNGDDILVGGDGDDAMSGGAGNDLFVFGAVDARRDDGDDLYDGGSGADTFLLRGEFGDDVIRDLRLAEGDQLVALNGDWGSEAGLRALNGSVVLLERARADKDDLVVTFRFGRETSTLMLDEFFALNRGFDTAPRSGALSDAQALPLLHALFADEGALSVNVAYADLIQIGEVLSLLG
ncbi:hypothetical protein GCM10011335_42170 [Aureimonas glaciei]|uniref:Calcium-binding protein n=2 Tax=Aureimonas glaciei TaxID=1776957 RepID=A0A916Y8X4_9HYPH|nr:hypothetical protein GCM10011335_42170 [Aureimonas glaciei]